MRAWLAAFVIATTGCTSQSGTSKTTPSSARTSAPSSGVPARPEPPRLTVTSSEGTQAAQAGTGCWGTGKAGTSTTRQCGDFFAIAYPLTALTVSIGADITVTAEPSEELRGGRMRLVAEDGCRGDQGRCSYTAAVLLEHDLPGRPPWVVSATVPAGRYVMSLGATGAWGDGEFGFLLEIR